MPSLQRPECPARDAAEADLVAVRVPASIPTVTRAGIIRLTRSAFPRRRRGIDSPLHMPGLDVLAGDRVQDRGHEQRAQPSLGMRVLPRPALLNREAVRVQVVGDQGRARLLHARGVGF
jgi:hypothetical protein